MSGWTMMYNLSCDFVSFCSSFDAISQCWFQSISFTCDYNVCVWQAHKKIESVNLIIITVKVHRAITRLKINPEECTPYGAMCDVLFPYIKYMTECESSSYNARQLYWLVRTPQHSAPSIGLHCIFQFLHCWTLCSIWVPYPMSIPDQIQTSKWK